MKKGSRCEVPPAVIIIRGSSALIPLCGMPLLKRTLFTLRSIGGQDVFILTGQQMGVLRETFGDGSDLGLCIRLVATDEASHLDTLPQGRLLVLEGNCIWDERILRMLSQVEGAAAVIDSESESPYVGAAKFESECEVLSPLPDARWPEQWLQTAGEETVTVIDIARLETHESEVRRALKPYWFCIQSDDDAQQAKSHLIERAQKGTLDWWAWYVNRPIENWLLRYVADWPVTPNQLSVVSNVAAYGLALIWATGHLWPWALLAVMVSVIDGLDGKVARVKGLASKLGTLEHSFDVLWEQAWYLALAWAGYTMQGSVTPLVLGLVVLLLDTFNRHIHMQFRQTTGASLSEYSEFDRAFRWIDGRRNTYLPYILIGAALGKPSLSLAAIVAHAGLTAMVYSIQAIRHLSKIR